MLAKTDVARIYDTVLSIPGMSDNVKIAFNIPRKNVLLLSKVIERGLSLKDPDDKSNNVLDWKLRAKYTTVTVQSIPVK